MCGFCSFFDCVGVILNVGSVGIVCVLFDFIWWDCVVGLEMCFKWIVCLILNKCILGLLCEVVVFLVIVFYEEVMVVVIEGVVLVFVVVVEDMDGILLSLVVF